jgi:hypothetical protein
MFDQAGLGIARKVHDEEINEYPDEFKSDYLRLSVWVRELGRRYGQRGVFVQVIDPMSLVGMYKSIRHRVGRYPTFIVAGTQKPVGLESSPLEALIERRLAAPGDRA